MVRPSLLAAAALIAGALLYPVAFQITDTVRFDLASMDWDYLMNEEQVYDRVRMQGPTRLPDGSVEVIEFYGRLTAREVGFRLPYHGDRLGLDPRFPLGSVASPCWTVFSLRVRRTRIADIASDPQIWSSPQVDDDRNGPGAPILSSFVFLDTTR